MEKGEQCDLGVSALCDPDCTKVVCGDGFRNKLAEKCDDGNSDNTDACVEFEGSCKVATCNDGFVQEGVETCDDGNPYAEDGCTPDCEISSDACGNPSLGTLWLEMDWTNAQSSTKPSFTSSSQWNTSVWAGPNENGPKITDNNYNVTIAGMPDNLGPSASIDALWDPSSLTLLFGLTKLKSYSAVTLCVEGRSAHWEKDVIFRAGMSNSGADCGKGFTGELGTALPQVYTSSVDLGTCLDAGDWLETVNIRPDGGSYQMYLKRMRLSFYNPVFK